MLHIMSLLNSGRSDNYQLQNIVVPKCHPQNSSFTNFILRNRNDYIHTHTHT